MTPEQPITVVFKVMDEAYINDIYASMLNVGPFRQTTILLRGKKIRDQSANARLTYNMEQQGTSNSHCSS